MVIDVAIYARSLFRAIAYAISTRHVTYVQDADGVRANREDDAMGLEDQLA